MGFSDKLERLAVEKERKRGCEDIRFLFNYLSNYDVDGLDLILDEIRFLMDSDVYVDLINAFKSEAYDKSKRAFTLSEVRKIRILNFAEDNLHFGGLMTTIFTNSLVVAKQFISIYSIIGYVYVIFSGKSTTWEDILNINFSGLDERIIFALDDFDTVDWDELPEPTTEYFQQLKKVKWENKNVKEVYNKLTELMQEIRLFVLDYPDLIETAGKLTTYRVTEDLFIQLLAACSAVNSGRLGVTGEDVVKSYKTFFKLIHTDVTQYKAIPELIEDIK